MRENEPSDTQSQAERGRQATAQDSITLASPNPHARRPERRGDSDQHFRAALDAGTRAGTSLTELQRTLADLQKGVDSATDVNARLARELDALKALLGDAGGQQRALGERVAQLEQELGAAERERQFLVAQQDEFLKALLDEHEAELRARDAGAAPSPTSGEIAALGERLARAEARLSQAEQEAAQARAELAITQSARDEARNLAGKYALERDALRAEASRLRASLGVHRPSTSPPPPTSNARAPSHRSAPALRLDDGELDTTLHGRGSTPIMPAVVPRFTPSWMTALPQPPSAPPEAATATAAIFPRESTRPGVGDARPSAAPPATFGPPPAGSSAWTPAPPAPDTEVSRSPWPVSAASLPPEAARVLPSLKRKPDPTTRPLIDYSLGEGGVETETLEGVKLSSSQPPRK